MELKCPLCKSENIETMVVLLPDGDVKPSKDGKTGKVKVKKVISHYYCKDDGVMFQNVKENKK